MQRAVSIAVLLLIGGVGIHSCTGDGFFVAGAISAYLLIMVIPGAALYQFLERKPAATELALSGLIISPVVVTALVALGMCLGLAAGGATVLLAIASGLIGVLALLMRSPCRMRWDVSARHALVLLGLIAATCTLTGYLPFTEEWWRVRSDAWFHGAVVAQIEDFGVPPEDPYFHGISLQYMWFYHILVLALSRATNVEPFTVMQFLNVHALVGFALATFAFANVFKKLFSHAISSVITVLFGMNAIFWAFLPVKLGRALVGEVRGFHVVERMLSLSPLDMDRAIRFVSIHHNQQFLLGKFIVATAFSLGLCFMATYWFASVACLSQRRRFPFELAFFACAGMIAFHTVVGAVMLAGLCGGLFLLHMSRSRIEEYDGKRSLALLAVSLLSVVVLSPYVYSMTHLKESQGLFPLILSSRKVIGLLISCALVVLLSLFQIKRLLRWRTPQARYLVFATLTIVSVCAVIRLPGPNTYDKPPFFMFYPLAVVGGWTLAGLFSRETSVLKRRAKIALIFLGLFLPLNLIVMLGCFNTPTTDVLSPWEKGVASWVRTHTARDAVFIDSNDRIFLLVAGPRRYFWGCESYAFHWGYDTREMNRRMHVRDNLYSGEELDRTTLESLADIAPDTYVIVREEDEATAGLEEFARYPKIFQLAHSEGPVHVFKVDKVACRDALVAPS